jgi:hypothetical protein
MAEREHTMQARTHDGQRDPEWVMPEWMELFRPYIEARCCGSTVERLMNLTWQQTRGNQILVALCCMCEAQVALLVRLRNDGKLIADV